MIANPQRKGRTFFNGGLQIRRDASRKTATSRIANPLGRLTKERKI